MKERGPTFIVGFVVAVLTFLVLVGLLWTNVRRETVRAARALHQRECPRMLELAWLAQQAHRAELARYGDDFVAIGFEPARGNYAAYVLDRRGPLAERRGEVLPTLPRVTVIGVDEFMWPKLSTARLLAALPATFVGGVREGLQDAGVVMACTTELPDGVGPVSWSVATFARSDGKGGEYPAGTVVPEPGAP